MKVTPGLTYTHIRTGHRYTVVDRCQTKVGKDWVDGVVYERYLTAGQLYVRPYREFVEKFERAA